MADERRPQRPSRDGGRGRDAQGSRGGAPSRSSTGRSSTGRTPGGRDAGGRDGGRDSGGRPFSRDRTDDKGRPARGGSDSRGGRGADRGNDRNDRNDRPRRDPSTRTVDQATYDGPELPDEITGRELDRAILSQLKSLPEKLAQRVARHLAAAGAAIDDDPELAFRHAVAARVRAPRLAVVREAAGEAAYAAGHYGEALADLRAAKRINGATAYLPIMADCHRALGHPDQALKLAKSPSVANFAAAPKAEMTIVEAGARRDMGQLDAALRTLELAPLQAKAREPWVVRLRYAYADTLAEAGRTSDAVAWFHRTHAIDSEELTDAAERAAALEKQLPPD